MQEELNLLLGPRPPVDGIAETPTGAILNLQRAHGLVTDEVAGAVTTAPEPLLLLAVG